MKNFLLVLLITCGIAMGCNSTQLVFPPQTPLKLEKNQTVASYPIQAESCGFQLLLFIPISVNDRQVSAYQRLTMQAAGGVLSNIRMEESWFYGLVGTGYCTKFSAMVSRAQ